jgi:hypothetical protein
MLGPDWNRRFKLQTMLTVLTQNSRLRRSAGCISGEWRQKGEFFPGAEWLPERGSALRPKSSVGSHPMRTIPNRTRRFGGIEIR